MGWSRGWERHVTYRGTKIKIIADFSLKTMPEDNRAISPIIERKTNPTNLESIPSYYVIKNMVAFLYSSWSEPLNPWNFASDRSVCYSRWGLIFMQMK